MAGMRNIQLDQTHILHREGYTNQITQTRPDYTD